MKYISTFESITASLLTEIYTVVSILKELRIPTLRCMQHPEEQYPGPEFYTGSSSWESRKGGRFYCPHLDNAISFSKCRRNVACKDKLTLEHDVELDWLKKEGKKVLYRCSNNQ
ncbi:hypothetical protein VTN02DRAFT_2980 [Thermoascus thermophilus]